MLCLIVGDANADLCATLDCFPLEGDDAPITSLGFSSGGTAANVAVAYVRLGGVARLLARIGNDPAASVAMRAAHASGLDLKFVQYDRDRATGLCLAAISPHGERTFFSYRGANVALELPNIDQVFQDVRFLHISGHALLEGNQRTTALALLDEAHRRDIPASLDLCLPLLRKRPQEILTLAPRLSVIFANARELALLGTSLGLTGNDSDLVEFALSSLTHAGTPYVVAKLGAAGSRIARGSSRFDVPPFPVTAVDTTGAGDGFVAAFLFVLQRGGSAETAAQVGNIVGALIASRSGAAEASPNRDEVCAMLAAQGATKALDVFAK
jgi:ribokinase